MISLVHDIIIITGDDNEVDNDDEAVRLLFIQNHLATNKFSLSGMKCTENISFRVFTL